MSAVWFMGSPSPPVSLAGVTETEARGSDASGDMVRFVLLPEDVSYKTMTPVDPSAYSRMISAPSELSLALMRMGSMYQGGERVWGAGVFWRSACTSTSAWTCTYRVAYAATRAERS